MNSLPASHPRQDENPSPAPTAGPVFTLMLDGWLVWDGLYETLRVGDVFDASVEFAPLTTPALVDQRSERSLRQLEGNRYAATGLVRHHEAAHVLMTEELTVLRWARPDEEPGALVDGETVALETRLNLNPWAEADWSRNAASLHAALYRWRVEHMTRFDADADAGTELDECSTDTVDSAGQYCLLECRLLGPA